MPADIPFGLVPLHLGFGSRREQAGASADAPKRPRTYTAEDLQRIRREVQADCSEPVEPAPASTPQAAGPGEAAPAPMPQGAEQDRAAPAPVVAQVAPVEAKAAPRASLGAAAAPLPSASLPPAPMSATQRRAERALWRYACDWLHLHRLCRRARCRHAGGCRGDPAACLRAGVPQVPEAARDFVVAMLKAQEVELPFEQAFEDAADYSDGYFAWIAGLDAVARARR